MSATWTQGTNLAVPSIRKEEEMEAIENDVERESTRMEKFTSEEVLAHCAGLLSQIVRIPNERRPAGQTKE